MAEYIPDQEVFEVYIEWLKLFFDSNDIADKKKTDVFLTLVDSKNYATLQGLIHPSDPTTKSFEELVTILKNHFSPVWSIVAERFKFNRRYQGNDETIAEYVTLLKTWRCFANILNS